MIVLGIDPGIARLGWGVIEGDSGQQKAIAFGCIETHKNQLIEQRLIKIADQLKSIIAKHKPEILAIEDLFFAANAKTAFQVGQARGVALLTAAQANLRVAGYTPLKIKMALVGYGRADKTQVQKMVEAILKLKKSPKLDDTADALAVALTYLFLQKLEKKIKL